MATFHPNQRVKITAGAAHQTRANAIGKEAIFLRYCSPIFGLDCLIHFEGKEQFHDSRALVPLTGPTADAFIERIKKLAREPQPLAKEKA